ncbi:MAG: phosphate acyltransferase PlsX [Acidimicrobiales bacterium]
MLLPKASVIVAMPPSCRTESAETVVGITAVKPSRSSSALEHLPIALDAMGGDNAPSQIVEGALAAAAEHGISVMLVGRPDELGDVGNLEVLPASEVIPMEADAGSSVRRMKDSSLVRAAEAVRDGRASAMVSAGNTGATMASALLRMGRIKGVSRPAIATPVPRLKGSPTLLLDAGANTECSPEMLLQFARLGLVYSRDRYGVQTPKVALLSIGEESNKGNSLVKDTHKAIANLPWGQLGAEFVGNVEGRDLMTDAADVVVTDGFTGNVALKALEGGMKTLIGGLLDAFGSSPEAEAAAGVLAPSLEPLYRKFDPDTYGSAVLLGVNGLCMVSHGSSSASAISNALVTTAELLSTNLVEHLRSAIAT